MATAARRWTTPERLGGHGELDLGQLGAVESLQRPLPVAGQSGKRSTHPGLGKYVWMVTAACARKLLVEVARALVSQNGFPWEGLLPFIVSFSVT